MDDNKPPRNDAPNPSNSQPGPVHPSENPGLADEINGSGLGLPVDEVFKVLNDSAEHKIVADGIIKTRIERAAEIKKRSELKSRALEELASASGVVTASQTDIEQKMAEIEQRDIEQN